VKSTTKKVVFSSIFVAVCVLGVAVSMAEILATDNSPMAIAIREGRPLPEALFLKVQGVSENDGYCNVSLSIINSGLSPVTCEPSAVTLDKILMEGTSVLTYINGTEIINPSQMRYTLNVNSTAQVNLIAPILNYSSTAGIEVDTPEGMYYIEARVF
jgi:hypothetical protein